MLLPVLALIAGAASADTTIWLVDNHGRRAGELTVVTKGDSVIARWIYTDRNRGGRVETRYLMGRDGRPNAAETRAVLPDGSAGEPTERFEVVGDSVRIRAGIGATGTSTMVALLPRAFVGLRGQPTPYEQAALARYLLAQTERAAPINGGTPARAEIVADTTLRVGAQRLRARLVMVFRGNPNSPTGVWLDDKGQLLATDVQWFITVRQGAEWLLPSLRSIELKYRNARAEALARTVVTPTNGTIVIRGGDLFDAESGVMRAAQTIVVRGDRIIAVGAADAVNIPAGATVIDATGKTVMPGMWDMHGHIQVSNQGALGVVQLANGLTTVRDLAADIDVARGIHRRAARVGWSQRSDRA